MEGEKEQVERSQAKVIQYEVGMEMDEDLNQLWTDYITESKAKFFWLFLTKFVRKWEHKVIPTWELLVTSRLTGGREIGPEMRVLPEELLAALSKFLFIGKDETEQGTINKETMEEVRLIVKSLTIVCLNTENIPLVASMDFVTLITQLSALLLQHLLEMESTFFSSRVHSEVSGQNIRSCIVVSIVESCHFLETLYDPYFRWRSYLCGKDLCQQTVQDSPVSLHPETIPFLYESFDTALVDSFPVIAYEMLTVFGAVMSGARHNARTAISPATTKMILKTVRDSQTSQEIHINAIYCSSKAIRILHETPLEERQLELGSLVEQYQEILLSLATKPEASLATLIEGIALMTRTLDVQNSNELQELFARRGLLSNLLVVVEDCSLPGDQKRTLLPVIINRISLVLQNCVYAQRLMEKDGLYTRLFQIIDSCGPPDYNTLHAILAISTYGHDPTVGSKRIHTIQPIKQLLHWLTVTEYENHDQQVWLTESLHNLCVATIQNKTLCCETGLIRNIVDTLKRFERLQWHSAEYLLKLIEALGQHSLLPEELKLLIIFLQNETKDFDEEENFPFKSHVIHIISSIAKGDGFEQSRQYFDIQESVEGVSVPGVLEWAGPVAGFTFHAWIRLDAVRPNPDVNTRRQLYSLYTSSGTGLEAFFLPDGVLAVATAHKKEFLTTKCDQFPLVDGRWHAVTICHAAGKRPFGHSQLSVYIDGTMRVQSQLKYPTFSEPVAYCQLGSELVRANLTGGGLSSGAIAGTDATSSGRASIKENIKDALKSSGVFAIPQYLKPTNNDPLVHWTMVGMEEIMWGLSTPLHGQLGLMYGFQDSLTAGQVKLLYSLGANLTLSSSPDQDSHESADLLAKLVFNFSSRVCHNRVCTNLAPVGSGPLAPVTPLLDGHTLAKPVISYDAKDVINCLGGIQVLFPILETSLYDASNGLDTSTYFSLSQDQSRTGSMESEPEWELLPSSSFSDWKLEKNPVSGFLTLIKNLITNHPVNQEQLMRGGGVAIVGSLLQKVEARFIDVNVLMASQLFVEVATSTKQTKLLYQFYHSILLDFRIWSRSEFHMQIGHIQYLSTLIMADRKYFRKKFGVQLFLDVVRQHYMTPPGGPATGAGQPVGRLSPLDAQTIRGSLFGLVKFFLQKEVNAKEVAAIVNFMFICRKSLVLGEILDILLLYMESKFARDQMFLLLLEPKCADLMYCILLEPIEQSVRLKLMRLMTLLMRSPKVSNRHKTRMFLQEAGYLGFLYTRCQKDSPVTREEVVHLTEQLLLVDSVTSLQGILALCHHLYLADLEIKVEIARKILTLVYTHSQAATVFSRQVGWQGCIARLLVNQMVQPELDGVVSVEDVISLDEEEEQIGKEEVPSPTHYINLVTDTAKLYLPEQASSAVEKVGTAADEATKVFADTTKLMRSNILSATDRVSSTVQRTQNLVSDKVQTTVKTANTILESVGDLTRSKRRRSEIPGGGGGGGGGGECGGSTPQFMNNYTYEFPDNGSEMSVSSEDISKSRETVCSSPTRTQDSVSEDDISFDMEHFSQELETLKLSHGPNSQNMEEELVQMVTNILFTILWRGTLSKHRKDQASQLMASYGQIVASINMLALNNTLFSSHVTLKRNLTELCLQALLSDIKDKHQGSGDEAILARHILEVCYDLVILDEHDDFCKKVSEPLLDGILGILDGFSVFHEGQSDKEWEEMGKMAFDILLECAENTKDLDFCAIATAKLHSLVQSRCESSDAEAGFLLFRINRIIQTALNREDTDHYAFLVPIIKALLDKSKVSLQLTKQLPSLNLRLTGCEFFSQFQDYCKQEEWEYFINRKVKPLHDDYSSGFLSTLRDTTNEYWGNCYEEAKVCIHRRNRLIGESKLIFMSQYNEPFRKRLKEEGNRYQNVLTQQRSNQIFVEKRWRIMKRLFFGPRGAWNRDGSSLGDHWMLANNENMLRMRMKLVPNPNFQNHLEASAQRDNIKRTPKQAEVFPIQISKEALVSIHKEDENDLTEEDLKAIAKEQMENNQESEGEQEHEKLLLGEECELVTLMMVIKGRFELTSSYLYFFDSRPIKDEEERYDNRWSVNNLKELHLRRFNLRKSALEIFLLDQTNFFLNFPTLKKRNKVFLKIVSLRPPNMIYQGTRSPKDWLKSSGLTQKWINREISNFEYLMHLNTIAGRSYNDLSQYPVFPWILSDYISPVLDLGSTATFRDLSMPMGVQNPRHVEEIRQKFENFEDPSGTIAKFHYGTHYSNSAMVLHYLVRVEPFTTLHINLQSGRFDVADRQFHSIPQTWSSLLNNINDVKELIPEFFFFPDFLLNHNYFDLGKLQGKKQSVNDVILPPWAKSVDDFVRQHRNALESEYVSAHLHEWIDLIFGYKQKGKEAEEAMNVFYYCCYEGAVNLDAISDPADREALEGMIQNFGQVPCQLLKEPHPQRISYTEHRERLMKADHRRQDILRYSSHWRPYCVELSDQRNPLLFIQHPAQQPKSILQYGAADSLIAISLDASIGNHSWLPFDRNVPNYFYLEKDPAANTKLAKRLPGPFSRGLKLKSKLFAVTPDARFIIYGGSWDCSLRIYSLARAKEVGSSIRHTHVISCVGVDEGGLHCISGSVDTTCIVWDLATGSADSTFNPRSVQVLYGHDAPVTTVAVSVSLDLAVTGSQDGTVNVHTVKEGQYLRTLRPRCTTPLAAPPTHSPAYTVELLVLSYQGHVIFTGHTPESHSLHVFTLNGRHVASCDISHRVTGLLTSGDWILTGDENGDLSLLDLYSLMVIKSLHLQLPIQTVATTQGNSHILAPLRDGKVIVVGLSGIPETFS